MDDEKRICDYGGCNNVGEWSKQVGDKIYRRRLCSKHRKGMDLAKKNGWDYEKFSKIKNKCSVCGWKGPCDIHRFESKKGYKNGNMISICPNCHRLVHLKELKV